jgi:hypothetical protein
VRFLAFLAFGLAAFDWPPPFLDRAGVAALGLAFLALALGPLVPRVRREPALTWPAGSGKVGDELRSTTATLADRLEGYGLTEARS